MSFKLKPKDFNKLLAHLKDEYKIYAPVRLVGMGRHSDTDVVRYGEIKTVEEIVLDEKSHFSTKELTFPTTETLFHFTDDEHIEAKAEEKGMIIFARPCDIHAMTSKDRVFLENGKMRDVYYERRRKKVKIFMIECTEGFESCFCVAMNTHKTDKYDVAVRFTDDEIQCEVKDETFKAIFEKYGTPIDFTPRFIEKNQITVTPPDVQKITNEFFEHPMWEEYGQRCIACGRCNFVCPTCTCWTMQDVATDEDETKGERRRVWSGCHVDGFTDMAGGHGFRKNYGDRMRFKTMHKIYDYKKRHNTHMCIGCGRCDDVCPEYISFSNCINKVNEALEGGGKDGR